MMTEMSIPFQRCVRSTAMIVAVALDTVSATRVTGVFAPDCEDKQSDRAGLPQDKYSLVVRVS
jgi:hypothetical protein